MKKMAIGICLLAMAVIPASCRSDMTNLRDSTLSKKFSEKSVEKGKESDHSLVRLSLKRGDNNSLIVTAEAWGVSEAGPFIRVQRKDNSLVFVSLAHCGTIESSTPVKLKETYILSDVEELQIMDIQFQHNDQTIVIEK